MCTDVYVGSHSMAVNSGLSSSSKSLHKSGLREQIGLDVKFGES